MHKNVFHQGKGKKKIKGRRDGKWQKKWCLTTLLAAGYSLSYLLCCGYSVGDAFYEIFAVSCYQLFSMAIILSIAQEGQRFLQEVCSKVRQHCVKGFDTSGGEDQVL
jgi:hypothetical protein